MALEDGVTVKIGGDSSELQAELDSLKSKMAGVGESLTSIGTGLTGILTVPLVALGAGAHEAFSAIDEGLDLTRTKTGATGEALAGLGESFRNVLTGVPDAAHAVAIAFSEVAAKTGMVGEPLEALTKNFLDLSRITGEELQPLIANTSRLFGDWSIASDQQAASMDKLFRTAQLTGQGFTGLSEKLVQYGAPLRQLGFSFDEAAIMIGKFQKEGVNTEIVLGAMRTALGKFAAAGLEPKKAFQDLIEGIKGADTATGNMLAKSATNVKVFADFAAAVREGRFEFDDLIESMEKGTDTIGQAAKDTADFAESWGEFRNKMTVALEPLGAAFDKLMVDLAPAFEVVIGLTKSLADWFAHLSPTAQIVAIALAALAAAAGPAMVALGMMASAVAALMAPAALAALVVAAKALAIGIAAVAVAWGAWKLGEWLYQFAPVKVALQWYIDAMKTMWEWLSKMPTVMLAVKAGGAAWDAVKHAMAGLAETAKTVQKHITDAAAGVKKTGDEAEKLPPKLGSAGSGLNLFGKGAAAAAEEAKKFQEKLSGIGKGIADMMSAWPKSGQWDFAAFKQAVAEGFKVEQAIKQINEKVSDINIQFGEKMPAAMRQTITNLTVLKNSYIDFADRLAKEQLDAQFIKLSAAIAKIPPDLKAAAEGLKLAASVDFSAIEGAAKSVRDMDAAAKTLGVTWDRDVNGALERARAAFELMNDGWRKGTVSTREYNLALVGYLNQQIEAAKKLDATSVEGKKRIGELGEALEEAKKKVGSFNTASDGMAKNFNEFGKQVSTIFSDFGKDVATAIVHWDGLGAAATKCWVAIKEAFIRNIVEGTFKELFSNIKLVDFQFGELGKTVQKLFNNIAKLFGTGASTAAKTTTTATEAGLEGGVGAAAGGFTGIVSAVTGAITAVTSVLGYLQGRRMEQDIGRMEVTSREIKAELMNFRADAWTREAHWYARTSDMWQTSLNIFEVLKQIRDAGIQTVRTLEETQLMGEAVDLPLTMVEFGNTQALGTKEMLVALSHIYDVLRAVNMGTDNIVKSVGTGTMNLWNLINGVTNKLLGSIAQSTSMLYQIMAKPGFTGAGTELPVLFSGGGGTNITNNVNLTTTSSDPNALSRMVQNAITQAMGRL